MKRACLLASTLLVGCVVSNPDASTSGGSGTDSDTETGTGTTTSTSGASCGDGTVDTGEECDDGQANADTANCKSDCTTQACGDGFVGPGEGCDDGNTVNDDECTNACAVATCGDGEPNAGEACDDGNADDTDACLSTCVAASCGDGFVFGGREDCDDANADATDGCDACAWVLECDDGNIVPGELCYEDPLVLDASFDVRAIALGDLTGDDNLDIIIAMSGADGLRIFEGDGAGGFVYLADYSPNGAFPFDVEIADFDSDGNMDVAVATLMSDAVDILFGSGDKLDLFPEIVTVPTAGTWPSRTVASDRNGDGEIDFSVIAGAEDVNGCFQAETHYSQGDRTFVAGPSVETCNAMPNVLPSGIASGDINGDGQPDVAVTWTELDELAIFDTGMAPDPIIVDAAGRVPRSVAIDDFNGDGAMDIVTANWDQIACDYPMDVNACAGDTVSLMLAEAGSLTPMAPVDFMVGKGALSVATGDFDFDGNRDVLTVSSAVDEVTILQGDGAGGFGTAAAVVVGAGNPADLAVADINGDGVDDFVTVNQANNTVSVLVSSG